MADDLFRWLLISNRKLEADLVRAVFLLRNHGIEPICVKGWAAARYYPDDDLRGYTDVDLAVRHVDHAQALKMLRDNYFSAIPLDIHCEFRRLDDRTWAELFDRSRRIELDGTPIRVLSDEDHLRLICVHWLTDGGVNKERLKDIAYLIQNCDGDLDWDIVFGEKSSARANWVRIAVATAREFAAIDDQKLPATILDTELPNWYVKHLNREWALGVYLRKPLWMTITTPAELKKQLARRFPPNPIAAAVEAGYPLVDGPVFPIQISALKNKIRPALRSLARRFGAKGIKDVAK